MLPQPYASRTFSLLPSLATFIRGWVTHGGLPQARAAAAAAGLCGRGRPRS